MSENAVKYLGEFSPADLARNLEIGYLRNFFADYISIEDAD